MKTLRKDFHIHSYCRLCPSLYILITTSGSVILLQLGLPSSSIEGSTFGDRKAMNRFRWYMPKAYVTIYQP